MENEIIKATVEYVDLKFEMVFNNMEQYAGACKLAQQIRMKDWADIYVEQVNPIQLKIDELEEQIKKLKAEQKELMKQL